MNLYSIYHIIIIVIILLIYVSQKAQWKISFAKLVHFISVFKPSLNKDYYYYYY